MHGPRGACHLEVVVDGLPLFGSRRVTELFSRRRASGRNDATQNRWDLETELCGSWGQVVT